MFVLFQVISISIKVLVDSLNFHQRVKEVWSGMPDIEPTRRRSEYYCHRLSKHSLIFPQVLPGWCCDSNQPTRLTNGDHSHCQLTSLQIVNYRGAPAVTLSCHSQGWGKASISIITHSTYIKEYKNLNIYVLPLISFFSVSKSIPHDMILYQYNNKNHVRS